MKVQKSEASDAARGRWQRDLRLHIQEHTTMRRCHYQVRISAPLVSHLLAGCAKKNWTKMGEKVFVPWVSSTDVGIYSTRETNIYNYDDNKRNSHMLFLNCFDVEKCKKKKKRFPIFVIWRKWVKWKCSVCSCRHCQWCSDQSCLFCSLWVCQCVWAGELVLN